MQTVDQFIHPQFIIPCEESPVVLENHILVTNQGKIEAIVPEKVASTLYTPTSTLRLSSHAVLPGFINAHTHVGMNYFRGLADDLPLMTWLNNHIWPAEKKWLSHELVYDASLFAIAEMIRGGTTCFNDMFFFLEATAQAIDLSGMRGNVSIHVIDFPTNWTKDTAESLERGMVFLSQYYQHPRITTAISPHAVYTVTENSLLQVKEIAAQFNLKINMHIQESADEVNQFVAKANMRPLKKLYELGLVSPQLIAIHMTQINEEDMAILAEKRPNIVTCPESNMKLASGICPVDKLKKIGLNIALGTDSVASNNDLDMMGEMRSAAFLSKVSTLNPESLSAESVLQCATLNGAKALGLENRIGSLTPGKSADFIAIDLSQIETQPLYHPISQIVYAATRNQVSDVWIAGKQLLKNRQLTTIDEREIIAKAHYWRDKINSTNTQKIFSQSTL